jgi:beta-glucosidase
VGQLPDFYDHFPSRKDSYIEGDSSPLFIFGRGLSYTTFKYDQLAVTTQSMDDDFTVSVRVANTGTREGDEVAQLYVRQETASVVTPVKALKGFSRIHLLAGESKTVLFRLKPANLAVWGASQQWKVEPGKYTIFVGGSSQATLSSQFTL